LTVGLKNKQMNVVKTYWIKYKKYIVRFIVFLLFAFIIWYIQCLPEKLFNDGTSTVLLDRSGNLLGAKIAPDGQWRFDPADSISKKFETCLIEFEDRKFYKHHGISLKAILRAISQNIEHKKVVSGGSTITMQLARVMRKNPKRTYFEKILEMILATRIEIGYSKDEILRFYADHAPFGNNVVGLEAASWRYYGKNSNLLSWSECATLAVLPNAPGLIYPGKNHDRLLNKRNRLLKRLYDIKKIDKTTYDLALLEPLPDKPLRLPQLAPHLLEKLIKNGYAGKTIKSTIDRNLQVKAIQQLQAHSELLQENKIYNGAIIITSVQTGEILAYVGNTNGSNIDNSVNVDCADAPRSSGSILKPILYAKCLEDGIITPKMLLPDIPTHYGSFSPKNFSLQYNGAVHANDALSRSLNIPMVNLLNEYGLGKFYLDLKKYGFTTLNKPASHYGLSLILGGAEVKLNDLNKVYTQMAQELVYNESTPISITTKSSEKQNKITLTKSNIAAIYSTFEAMVEVNRPDDEGNWKAFSSSQKIAWKTGTSFGFRDAWAVGITTDFVVSVWIGNADGEGRPGLTGIKAAAPLLFDLFSQLPKSNSWFIAPRSEQCQITICSESGFRASDLCEKTETAWAPKTCLNTTACPYHQVVHLSRNGKYRVDSDCESIYNMKNTSWFILPPLIEKYYKANHPNYKVLPEYRSDCLTKISDKAIAVLYPKPNSKLYVPIEIDGNMGKVVFEATHKNSNIKLYWHLDDEYLGETTEIHQISLNPSVGKHKLLLIDENGIAVALKFEVVGKEK
jgi:penicillin-binding protein 1C